ncbi:hypothetical protein BCR35DRAFT_310513 [Leucosporidium creatinivorum]|uniref:histidine kinase n=1 Tax=Leucosporidium creatinivorum TaxID=106004 RepID=A0A1Y2D270_9BASI|nr:hypothetical protein BCR35DRAFT_310513 [Leucosporidium creatinivorum]
MVEPGARPLPLELLAYVASLPLPALVFSNPTSTVEELQAPIAQNKALQEVLGGSTLAACLTKVQQKEVLKLFAGRKGSVEEIELDLRIPATGETRIMRFSITRSLRVLILTAIPPSPISFAFPSPSPPSTEASAPHSSITTITTDAPTKPPASPKPPVFSLPPDSPVELQELAAMTWDAPIGLLWADLYLNVLWCNKRWFELAGLPADANPNAWPAQVLPEDLPAVQAYAERMTDTLEPCELEFRWVSNDSTESWCVSNLDVVRNTVGERVGVVGSLYNIQKRKTRELKDLREKEQYRAIREAEIAKAAAMEREMALLSKMSTVGLVRIDLEGHFIEANDAWYSIVKLPRDAPLDDWQKLVHPDDIDEIMNNWAIALKTLTPLEVTIRWIYDEISLVQAAPNHPDPAKATGWIGSVTNVTAQKRAEQALLSVSQDREADARKAAEEAEAQKEVVIEEKRQQELFLDVASHEIRNPISAILNNSEFTRSSLEELKKAFVELQKTGSVPSVFSSKIVEDLDEDIEALDSIHSCGLAQERIANDILGLAQIQLSKYKISPIEFDLSHSLRNITRLFKTEAKAKDIDLQLEMGSSIARLGPHARVFADPTRLAQVCVNLLSNAMRFTATSKIRKVTLSVEVSAVPPNRAGPFIPPPETEFHIDKSVPVYLFFSVADTGPGMTEEETSQLFSSKPFFHTTMGGTGLGLWIVKNLCELQAGGVEVSSQPGLGSTFRAFITARSVDAGLPPAESAEKVPVMDGIRHATGIGSAPKVVLTKTAEVLPLKGMTVLCCEDNAINRKVLERQLKKAGAAEVLLAVDGQEGLDLMASDLQRRVDCVVMDIEMPVLDGLSATRIIREREKSMNGVRTRIVGLSGNARPAQIQMGLDAGMDAFVTKPCVTDLLRELLGHENTASSEVMAPVPTPAPKLPILTAESSSES